MKRIILFLLLLCNLKSFAQDIDANRVVARQSIYLRDRWIDSIKNDTNNLRFSNRSIMTSKSVYDFVSGRFVNVYTELGNKLFISDTSSMLFNYIRRKELKDTSDAIQLRINAMSGGGSGSLFGKDDTLFTTDRYVNENGKSFKFKNGTISIGSNDSVGNRLNYSFASNPIGADWSVTGTTPTTNGSNTVINGTTTLTSVFKTGVENWSAKFSFITNAKSSVKQNISFAIVPDTINAVTTRKFTFALSDTSGYINYFNNDGSSTPLKSNRGVQQFLWSGSDSIDVEITMRSKVIYAQMTNRSNGQRSYFTYDIGYAVANVGTIKLINEGNFTFFGNITYKIDEPSRPRFLITGNSTEAGSGVLFLQNRWSNKLFEKYKDKFVVHAGGGERSFYSIARIDEALNWINPDYVIYCYGVNDLAGGSIKLFSNNARRYADSVLAHGKGLLFMSLVPQAANVATFNDTIQAIAIAKGAKYINITSTLQAGSADFNKNNLYKPANDAVHVNEVGQQLQADVTESSIKNLLTIRSGLVLDASPYSSRYEYLLGVDKNNQAVLVQEGASSKYVRIVDYVGGVSTGQDGDVFVNGSVLVANGNTKFFYVIGSGNQANPNFKVDGSTGTTTVAILSASGGHLTVNGSQTTIASNWLQFTNGAFIRSLSSNPLRLKTNISGPGAGTYGTIASTEGSLPAGNFKPLGIAVQDSIKAFFDRNGGLWLNQQGEAGARFRFKGITDSSMLYADASTNNIGIGTTSALSKLEVNGSFGSNITTVTNNTTLDATHYMVLVDATAGNVTINLPAASTAIRRIYVIKKIDASANTVTIDASGSELIDGALTQVINSQWSSRTIQVNATAWYIH